MVYFYNNFLFEVNGDFSKHIICQTWTGGPIPKPLLRRLYQIARYMITMEDKQSRISASDCDGYIETEWKRTSVSGFTGIRFHAFVEIEAGSFDVWFILRDQDEHLSAIESAIGLSLGPDMNFDPENQFPEFMDK